MITEEMLSMKSSFLTIDFDEVNNLHCTMIFQMVSPKERKIWVRTWLNVLRK